MLCILIEWSRYVGNSSTTVALPVTVADNATVLTYQGDSATCVKLSVGGQKNITTIVSIQAIPTRTWFQGHF